MNRAPVKEVVYKTARKLTRTDTTVIFTNRDLKEFIFKRHPDFNLANVNCELRADCVNNPERDSHYPDRINYDYYWWVARGKYRLYDPETDKF